MKGKGQGEGVMLKEQLHVKCLLPSRAVVEAPMPPNPRNPIRPPPLRLLLLLTPVAVVAPFLLKDVGL
jgi:hypothetical protein